MFTEKMPQAQIPIKLAMQCNQATKDIDIFGRHILPTPSGFLAKEFCRHTLRTD